MQRERAEAKEASKREAELRAQLDAVEQERRRLAAEAAARDAERAAARQQEEQQRNVAVWLCQLQMIYVSCCMSYPR